MTKEKYIVWFSGNGYNEISLVENYEFNSNLDNSEILENGKIIGMTENGKAYTFENKNEYLAYWDNIEANKIGNRLHYFKLENALSYIADDMEYCDNEKEIAEMYSEILEKVSKLLK